jgi:hypothetical protein
MKKVMDYLYPKAYQYIPNDYSSPKSLALSICNRFPDEFTDKDSDCTNTCEYFYNTNLNEITKYVEKIWKDKIKTEDAFITELNRFHIYLAIKYDMPCFFIDSTLLKALENTNISIDNKVKLPFPSQFLFFPKSLYKFNCFSVLDFFNIGFDVTGDDKFAMTCWLPDITGNSQEINSYKNWAKDSKIYDTVCKLFLFIKLKQNNYQKSQPLIAEDEPRTKSGACFWTPNWIGKDYQIKTERGSSKGGTHSSPRTHWRRGHFREQPIGEGRNETKTIWIEPTLIN